MMGTNSPKTKPITAFTVSNVIPRSASLATRTTLPHAAAAAAVYRNDDWKSMLPLFRMPASTCLCPVFYFPSTTEAACCVIRTPIEREKQIDYVNEALGKKNFLCRFTLRRVCICNMNEALIRDVILYVAVGLLMLMQRRVSSILL